MLRRIFLIACCCIIAFTFSYVENKNVELIPVMAVPVSNKVVIIDAGHGTPDERS